MGRAAPVEASDVWNVAEALLQDGVAPTGERIRQRLGRASREQIGAHLDAWFMQLGPRLSAPADPGSAQPLPEAVLEAASELWRAACGAAQAQAAARIDTLEEEIERLHQDAAARVAAMTATEHALRRSVDEALADADLMRQQAAQLQVTVQLHRDELALSSTDRDAFRDQVAQLAQRLLEQEQAFDDERRATAIEHARREAALRESIAEANGRHEEAEEAAQHARELRAALDERDEELGRLVEGLAAARGDVERLERLWQESTDRLQHQAHEFEAVRRDFDQRHAATEQRLLADVDRAREEAGHVYLKLVAAEQERQEYADLGAALAADDQAHRQAIALASARTEESVRRAEALEAELASRNAELGKLREQLGASVSKAAQLDATLQLVRDADQAKAEQLTASHALIRELEAQAEAAPSATDAAAAAAAAQERLDEIAGPVEASEIERLQAELDEVKGQLWAADAQCRTLMRSLAAQRTGLTSIGSSLAGHAAERMRQSAPQRIPRDA